MLVSSWLIELSSKQQGVLQVLDPVRTRRD
jgi:hypothetical protein